MGYDAQCTIRFEGRTARGTAWLEHKDLIFRGPFRVAIPLKDVTQADARDGTLHIRFGDTRAELDLGDVAPKWASRIANPPSRLDKLGIKAGMKVALVALSDPVFERELRARGADVISGRAHGQDAVFFAVSRRDDLERLEPLKKTIQPAGAIWVIRPKGDRAITEADSMAGGKKAGLVDVKVVSFSETHTAEKYVIPVARRESLRRSSSVSPRKRGSPSSRGRS